MTCKRLIFYVEVFNQLESFTYIFIFYTSPLTPLISTWESLNLIAPRSPYQPSP